MLALHVHNPIARLLTVVVLLGLRQNYVRATKSKRLNPRSNQFVHLRCAVSNRMADCLAPQQG